MTEYPIGNEPGEEFDLAADDESDVLDPQPYPLDFEGLEKGSIIPEWIVAHYAGCTPQSEPKQYDLKRLALKDKIETHFSKERGVNVFITSHQDGLRILTDVEVAPYIARRRRAAKRRYRRDLAAARGIDLSALPDKERQTTEREIEVLGKTIQGINVAEGRQLPKMESHQRRTPGLPESVDLEEQLEYDAE